MQTLNRPYSVSALALRVGGLTLLSLVLGLAFNASNPVGIRLAEQPPKPAAKTPLTTPTTPPPAPVVATVQKPSATPPKAPAPASVPASNPLSVPIISSAAAPAKPAEPAVAPSFTAPSPTTWAQVKPLITVNKLVLIDARAKGAYEAGHIPGAISLPESSSPEELNQFRTATGTNTHVVVYCSSTSCSLSFKLAYKLAKDYGFTHVQYMTGGYLEYQRENGLSPEAPPPVSTAIAPTPANTSPSIRTEAVVNRPSTPAIPNPVLPLPPPTVNPQPTSWTKVDELITEPKTVVVDVRSEEEYKSGHFAGAVSLPATATAERINAFLKQQAADAQLVIYGEFSGSTTTFQMARQLLQARQGRGVRFVIEGYQEHKASANRIAAPKSGG